MCKKDRVNNLHRGDVQGRHGEELAQMHRGDVQERRGEELAQRVCARQTW